MTPWLVVLVAGALSYAFRLVPAVLVGRLRSLSNLERAAVFVVPATFAAVAATGVVARAGAGPGPVPPLGALAVAVAVARRTGSSLAAVAAGLPTLWLLDHAVGF